MMRARAQGAEQRFEVVAYPVGERALAENGPVQHGAAIDLLDEAGKIGGVAGEEFASGHGGVEELARFAADGFELREGNGAEVGIGEIDLEIGEAVGHSFGRGGEAGAIHVEFDQGLQRRSMLCTRCGELLDNGGRSSFHSGEEQRALGAEALDERGGNDANFFGDVCEGEVRGAAALHDAGGGGEDGFVGCFAGAGRHFFAGFLARGAKQTAAAGPE